MADAAVTVVEDDGRVTERESSNEDTSPSPAPALVLVVARGEGAEGS